MGLGDEIMALGRAEALFEKTGQPVAITRLGGYARAHDAWLGNPAWNPFFEDGQVVTGGNQIVDGAAQRPYIDHWMMGRRIKFNMAYRPRAGRIHLTDGEREFADGMGDYFVVAPFGKSGGSPNKEWSRDRWEAVIGGLPLPVYQVMPDNRQPVIAGARALVTPTFRHAAAVIERAKLVMCNEGGTHHMAASMRTPAVVIFGAFVPPCVTGYDFHHNLSVETEHGFCGNFDYCQHCQDALETITPDVVKSIVNEYLVGRE